jgi:hypothetical protein
MLNSDLICPGQHQSRLHARPSFVSPYRASAHFHPANHLLSAIIGPRDLRIGVKGTVVLPGFAQSDEQVTQLVDRSEMVRAFPPANRDSLPKGIQAFIAFQRQLGDQFLDLLQYP